MYTHGKIPGDDGSKAASLVAWVPNCAPRLLGVPQGAPACAVDCLSFEETTAAAVRRRCCYVSCLCEAGLWSGHDHAVGYLFLTARGRRGNVTEIPRGAACRPREFGNPWPGTWANLRTPSAMEAVVPQSPQKGRAGLRVPCCFESSPVSPWGPPGAGLQGERAVPPASPLGTSAHS